MSYQIHQQRSGSLFKSVKMKAARFYAARDIRIEEIPFPSPSPEQVLVAVEWCGICGSDLGEYLVGEQLAAFHPTQAPHSSVT